MNLWLIAPTWMISLPLTKSGKMKVVKVAEENIYWQRHYSCGGFPEE
jgi:hypothetical protein